jgi:hypothetical protein
MKTNIHLSLFLSQFFLEWEMFQTKVIEKIKTHFMCSNLFFGKSCNLWDNVEKYGRARQVTGDSILRSVHCACWITKATDARSEYVTRIAFPR